MEVLYPFFGFAAMLGGLYLICCFLFGFYDCIAKSRPAPPAEEQEPYEVPEEDLAEFPDDDPSEVAAVKLLGEVCEAPSVEEYEPDGLDFWWKMMDQASFTLSEPPMAKHYVAILRRYNVPNSQQLKLMDQYLQASQEKRLMAWRLLFQYGLCRDEEGRGRGYGVRGLTNVRRRRPGGVNTRTGRTQLGDF